jgi:hypothetical protein
MLVSDTVRCVLSMAPMDGTVMASKTAAMAAIRDQQLDQREPVVCAARRVAAGRI